MPEGVECLVVAESIQQWCKNQDYNNSGSVDFRLENIYDKALIRNTPISFDNFNNLYQKINYTKISTFGKNIFLPSINNYCLGVQLGMTGSFSENQETYSRLKFSSGLADLYYNDMRKFGLLMLFDKDNKPRNIMSLLRNSIDWRNPKASRLFAKRVKRMKVWQNAEIKTVLINQQLIAGIGNIYASECLFEARVNPKIKVKDLSDDKLIEIIQKCQEIMNKSYELGGMSVYTFTNFGKKGFGRSLLSVYNRRGLVCKKCNGAIIQRIKQKNRSTFYCPKCQDEKLLCQEEKKLRT